MKPVPSGLAGLAVITAISLSAPSALAAACAPQAEFAKHLEMNYKERMEGVGVANDGSLFQIFTSDNGSWSLLITNGKKISCIVAAGDMWVAKPVLGPEAKLR
ncbi:MAG TPA: hypothetical protein VIB38_13765 [Aestuariivirgaceae bacterium]|jgi:hypothetical protein